MAEYVGPAFSYSSGNVAAATATATAAAPTFGSWIVTGFEVTGGGATAGSIINGTITGLVGGTMTFSVPVIAGVLLGITPIKWDFPGGLRGNPATAIVLSVPTFGAGNTNAAVILHVMLLP